MPLKTLYFFTLTAKDGPVGGWSEEYYQDLTTLNSGWVIADAILTSRLTILAPAVRCDAVRISDEDNPAVAELRHKYVFGTYKAPGSKISDRINTTDAQWNSCLVTLYSDDVKYKRKIMIRGVPQAASIPLNSDEDAVKTDWYNNLMTYLKGLNGAVSIKRLQKPGDPNVIKYPLTSLAFDGTTATATLTDASKITKGMRVHLYHTREFPGSQGVHVITKVTQPAPPLVEWTITWNSKVPAGPEYRGQGYLLVVGYTYTKVAKNAFGGFTHRDTGRPFDLQRGRRSVAK